MKERKIKKHSDTHKQISIGAEIREVRKARKMTLQELTERTSCSLAYLSRIERGDANLSVELLAEISHALDVDPTWFFPRRSGNNDYEKNYVVRASERRSLSDFYTRKHEELGFTDQLLSSSLAGQCYMMMTKFEPGSHKDSIDLQGYAFEGEQHGVVIHGSIVLQLGEQKIDLHTGDSFSYPTEIPHRILNTSNQEARVVITMTPVRITW